MRLVARIEVPIRGLEVTRPVRPPGATAQNIRQRKCNQRSASKASGERGISVCHGVGMAALNRVPAGARRIMPQASKKCSDGCRHLISPANGDQAATIVARPLC